MSAVLTGLTLGLAVTAAGVYGFLPNRDRLVTGLVKATIVVAVAAAVSILAPVLVEILQSEGAGVSSPRPPR